MRVARNVAARCLSLAGASPVFRSEAEFQAAVIALAKANGWKCYHPYDSRKSESGFPDLTLSKAGRPGRLIFAELKYGKGKPSLAQETWLESLKGTEAEVYLWWDRDWQEIVDTLGK